jgi:hypothetical protein
MYGRASRRIIGHTEDPATEPPRRVRGALRENQNVGGGGHDCDMSKSQTIGTDTHPPLGPWFSTEAPLIDIDSSVHLPTRGE